MRRLLDQRAHGSNLSISVLACSKGAEVYSILWAIRSARPDLRIRMNAVDISREILEFAERGVYSRDSSPRQSTNHQDYAMGGNVAWATHRDQPVSIFERMTDGEMESMFEVEGDLARVRTWLKEGIRWLRGDAADAELVGFLGPQDMVIANRFLCHMKPAAAEKCLRNVAKLVRPGGYLFVSGLDLEVRTKIAVQMGWKPITDLMREIHEGDPSLNSGWPLEYWGLEPFCDDRTDWKIRYASVFQIGENLDSGSSLRGDKDPIELLGCSD